MSNTQEPPTPAPPPVQEPFDARTLDLLEMAAIGNLKAVLHYCASGVNINSKNAMNGWTALHWASHRGHEPVVRALLLRGARTDLMTNQGKTPIDLAKNSEIKALFGVKSTTSTSDESPSSSSSSSTTTTTTIITTPSIDTSESGPAATKSTFVPSYLAQPDLSKLWSLPEGSTDDPKLNQEAFQLLNSKIVSTDKTTKIPVINPAVGPTITNNNGSATTVTATTSGVVEKEILVYEESATDDNLLGAIFIHPQESIEKALKMVKDEIDHLPSTFSIARFNGSKAIPVNAKQYTRQVGELFRGEDAIVVVAKNS